MVDSEEAPMLQPCGHLAENGGSLTFGSSLQRQLASLQETLLRSHEQVLGDLQQQNLELQQELELLRGQLSECKSGPLFVPLAAAPAPAPAAAPGPLPGPLPIAHDAPSPLPCPLPTAPAAAPSPLQGFEQEAEQLLGLIQAPSGALSRGSSRATPPSPLQEAEQFLELLDTEKQEQEAEALKATVELKFQVEETGIDENVVDFPGQVVDTASLLVLDRWTFLVGAAIHLDRRNVKVQTEEESRYTFYEQWTVRSRYKRSETGKARLVNLGDGDTRTGDVLRDDSQYLQPYILMPFSTPRISWGVLGVVYLMWDILTIPLMVFDMPSELSDILGAMSYITCAYWVLDVPSQFFVGFEDKGVLEMRPSVIAKSYVKSWMVLDLSILALDMIIFTMDYIFDGSSSSNPLMTLRLSRMLRLLRFVRLLRLRKLTDAINLIMARLRSEYLVLVLKICRLIVFILIVNHYVACAWFLIGTMSGEEVNWIIVARIEHAGMPSQYLTAFHWALTQFCPATNNIGPVNGFERGFAILLVLYAFIVFSSFVSAVTNASNQLRAVKMDRIKQETMMHQFIGNKQVSADLWYRIQAFIVSRGLNDRIMIKEKDIALFLEIPESMRIELHKELYMPIVTSAPFMIVGASLDNKVLVKLAHNVIDEVHVQARKDVFVPGSDCFHCYFTRSGNMLYYSDLTDSAAVPLQKDQWLSEVVLWSPWKHTGFLVTQTFTEFILLEAHKFVNIVVQEGGQMYVYLRMLGLVLLASMDAADDSGEFCTDLGVGKQAMNQLAERSMRFAELEKRGRAKITGYQGDILPTRCDSAWG
ncbi:unnamed protein product [Polarella glacialis]|uniref:Ion transport domain-containing protein n=1 Tax=Polarella glacialis TaxID=89957 RepID=A0A813I3N1_POLGL|nr:unnamed protein product [Polarella glacialis]CAE8657409.1 unnamed protein product [Polarella glacialis]